MVEVGPLTEGGHPFVPEVETEFEGDEEEELEQAREVEEEQYDDDETLQPNEESRGSADDYVLPEQNKDVWKNFGYDNEAGRALRKLYAGVGQKGAAARVSYPRLIAPAQKWEAKAAAQKPCPQRARVAVPHSRRAPIDRDDPSYWYTPAPGRKPASEILAEMDAYRPQRPKLVEGRDQGAEKRGLQDKFRYGGGNAMPSGAMGHVPKGPMPDAESVRTPLEDRWDYVDDSGLTREQRGIFVDLTEAIKDKQGRLAELDAQDNVDSKPSKEKTKRNRESLQLQNDIQRCVTDMDKLLQIADS